MLRDTITKLRENNQKFTLLGIGPVSKIVVEAAFEVCKVHDYPLVFIASRNQVDLKSLGFGYLMGGMDQKEFVRLIKQLQEKTGYEGTVHICRDHGGPWQRNIELDEQYPVSLAMDIAKKSFRADIESGFTYLHIDPTKCPFSFTLDDICNWTVELIEFCEETRKALGKDPIDYEVGTEDIQGGLTSLNIFEDFLEKLVNQLKMKNLPLPTCIVAQTGTLVKIDRNVGRFDKEQSAEFVKIASKYDIRLKEHNGDYLNEAICKIHPDIGIAAMNVAPEFGLVETDAYLYLAEIEEQLNCEKPSNLRNLFINLTWQMSPWGKWLTEEIKKLSREEIEVDTHIRLLIARVCGHYVYNTREIKEALEKLSGNLTKFGSYDLECFVKNKVKRAVEFYVKHFWLED